MFELLEATNALVTAILDLTFFGHGLTRVLGFIGLFVALVLMWSWTQYLVTEVILDFREWRQKREAIKAGR
jgi:hypothetical protein